MLTAGMHQDFFLEYIDSVKIITTLFEKRML